MWFRAPDPAKVGLRRPRIKHGDYTLKYAFRGALKAVVSGGRFAGPYAFYGAKQPRVSGGEFTADLCFFASEGAVVEGGRFLGKSAFMGAQEPQVQGGEFVGPWALAESRGAVVQGGVFRGDQALAEANRARIAAGEFHGAETGRLSQGTLITGGVFHGPGFLTASRGAVVLGGEIRGEGALAGAEEVRVLLAGELPELAAPVSGVIAVRRIGRLSLPDGCPPGLTILAEEVGEGAEHACILPAGRIPDPAGDPAAALEALELLAGERG